MEETALTVFRLVVLAVMFVGLLSLVFIIVPGLTIIWVAGLVYGLVHGFTIWSGILFAVMTVLMVIGNVADNYMMGASARQRGASWLAIGVALLGGLIGTLAWPPLGGLLLAMIGLFTVEWIRLRDWRKAWDSTRSLLIGCGWAGVVRFAIGLVMIGLYAIWAFLL